MSSLNSEDFRRIVVFRACARVALSCVHSLLTVCLLSITAHKAARRKNKKASGDAPRKGPSPSLPLWAPGTLPVCGSHCYQMASQASLSQKGWGGNNSQLSATSSVRKRCSLKGEERNPFLEERQWQREDTVSQLLFNPLGVCTVEVQSPRKQKWSGD